MSQQPIDASKLEALCDSERRRLTGDPNVLGVGFGPKIVGGKQVPGVAVRYAVRRKAEDEEAMQRLGTQPLPREVEGFVTDVYVPDVAKPDAAPTGSRGGRREDPLVGGTSTTVLSDWHSFPTGYGTLGGICFDQASGDAMALSNAHVWGEDTGRDVIQPWLPIDEYFEGVVKLMACGPVISYLADWTAPSPLTVGLAAGAAAAWTAAIASDEEDPSRWGQRITDPAPGATTSSERIGLTASLPQNPLPGFQYTAKTRWDYTRITSAGSLQESIEEERRNDHLLLGKLVWTDRQQYGGGERIEICAELATFWAREARDYFVVAHCFPTSGSERVVRRVLHPGPCKARRQKQWECFSGFFPAGAAFQPPSSYPFHQGIYRFTGAGTPVFDQIVVDGSWNLLALRIPFEDGVRVDLIPAQSVEVEVSHTAQPVTVQALDPLGRVVDTATGGQQQRHAETLKLESELISAVRVTGGGGEGSLHGLCIGRELPDISHDRFRRFTYTGHLDLDLREARDRWGVMLSVHTVDNSPPGTDPIVAAQNLGGIPVAANTAQLATCITVMLLDHVFDVI